MLRTTFELNYLFSSISIFPFHPPNIVAAILYYLKNHEIFKSFLYGSMCYFCGERNSTFNEETLDMHYWKQCPMLKRCPHCKQVTTNY